MFKDETQLELEKWKERALAAELQVREQTERADLNYKNCQEFVGHWQNAASERDALRKVLEAIEEDYGLLFDKGDIQLTRLMSRVRKALDKCPPNCLDRWSDLGHAPNCPTRMCVKHGLTVCDECAAAARKAGVCDVPVYGGAQECGLPLPCDIHR